MPIESITVTRLADLRFGDRITSCDGRPHSPVRVVQRELAPIEEGSPAWGVRLQKPHPTSPVEHVWYPSQMDGHISEVHRFAWPPIPLLASKPPIMPTPSPTEGERTMSYITRTGNLAATPELREGERGLYTYARVIVTDRIRQDDGSYIDGAPIGYDVAVSGSEAVNLVAAAEESGNIRVTFSGRYRVTEYKGENGTRVQHQVRADEVGVSFRGQSVRVEKGTAGTEAGSQAGYGDDTPF